MPKQQNEYVICMGAGISQVPLLKSLQKKGIKIIAVDGNSSAPGFMYAQEVIVESIYSHEGVVKKLIELNQNYSFIAIVSNASGPAVITTSIVAERFGLNYISQKFAPVMVQKSQLRKYCSARNLNCPIGFESNLDVQFSYNINIPLIIKPDYPLIGKDSIFVRFGDTSIINAIKKASKSSYNKNAEISEFFDGDDIAALFYISGNNVKLLVLVDEFVGIDQDGKIIGLGGSIPSVLCNSEVKMLLIEYVEEFILDQKMENQLLLFSFRVSKDKKIKIIEVHADLGGKVFTTLLKFGLPNFEYFDFVSDVLLNKELTDFPKVTNPATFLTNIDSQVIHKNEKVVRVNNDIVIQKGSLNNNLILANNVIERKYKSLRFKPKQLERSINE